ncbi:Septal ring factor EnvC, activator of murein hydrolases AmiA and AmiB [Flavobacterium succinicans]|jgi:septal ring factor EnvC (AmiA/AmiB activator)|uniref:Septal ring factor EnvC, activator of murein hydrolases AmiA and AmiB n=1 Tax=Flavobacterium succinicans TaxID=29536 RepID=A0A1I4R5C4_9FLAO|nr:peptidoglycan DD-metalloendopeptidase family protein [Flavobacterium succinicans]SFM47461.1 Septal ring factor EnvC, activator of murein hydrolases AmiA and AmiB [Flavobacterium succinicans]
MPKFLLSILFLCLTSLVWGQESQQEKLEQRKAQILQEIRENESQLQSVKKKEKSAVTVVMLQANKIKLQEKLIKTTEKQAKVLGNDMYINQVKINKLKKELEILKEDYARMIVKSYKSRSEQSKAMFLLSSENFLQAYKRAQYMKQYSSYRKMQGEEIQSKSLQLQDYNGRLSIQKKEKQKVIADREKEKQELEKQRKEQQRLVNAIKKDKNKIMAAIRKKQSETKAIDRQIDRLIREAIAEANRKAAKDGTATGGSSSRIALTAEAKILADNFRANKGKLPWPVEKGFVSLGYGKQPHPVFPTLVINNSGVEITTESGASARSVFAGEVTNIMVLSPINKAVMIQHGDCFTVYQNLSSVAVSKGDKVGIKQNLGRIRTNNEGKTVLKFTISENANYNNPANWLYNM